MYNVSAYDDRPLPIGHDQTISQPAIVAAMAEAAELHDTDVVLEVGSGCGYNAAVLSKLARRVYSTEIIPELHEMAKANLSRVGGYDNIELILSNGSLGCKEHAPYDAIIVTASAPSVPISLKDQLAVGGRLIIPVFDDERGYDILTKVIRTSETQYEEVQLMEVQFVPLMGKEGHREDPAMVKLLRLLMRSKEAADEENDEMSGFV
eukprot:gene43587-54148_t